MNQKLLLGAAMLALSAGAAAAQVQPIVVSVTPTAQAEMTGTTVAYSFEGRTNVFATDFQVFYPYLTFDGELDVKGQSGWGFNLSGDADLDFAFADPSADLRGEIYYMLGDDSRVGAFAAMHVPNGTTGFGGFVRLDRGTVVYEQETGYYIGMMGGELRSDNALTFNEGGVLEPTLYSRLGLSSMGNGLDLGAGVIVRANDIVYVRTRAFVTVIGGTGVSANGTISFDLGDFKPYATAEIGWQPGNLHLGATIGALFEHQIGTGPVAVTAGGNIRFDNSPGMIPDGYAYIGLRLFRGALDDDGHLDP